MALLRRILDAGAGQGLDPRRAKRILLANRLALTGVCLILPFCAIFTAIGLPVFGAFTALIAAGYAAAPLLSRYGFYRLSRILMLATCNIAPVAFAVVVGNDARIQIYLFAVMCFPLVLFDPEDRKLIAFFTASPALLYLLLYLTNYFGVEPLSLSVQARRVIGTAMILATCASIIATLGFLFVSNVRAEAGLAATVARLEREKDLFQTIFRGVQDLVFLVDRDNRYVAANDRVKRYGGSPEAFIGKRPRDVVGPDEAEEYERRHEEVFRNGQSCTFERLHINSAGQSFIFNITLSPVVNAEGAVTGIVIVSRDVTDEKQMQAVLREARDSADAASNAKTFFLANVSHELRTPLAVIYGYTEMLNDMSLDDGARRAVETILRNCKQLNALVSDILDVSLIETGRLRIQRVPFPLVAEVEAPLSALRAEAEAKGLIFTIGYDESVPAIAHTDPVRLRQILTNVAGNAVKFTDKGRIDVTARTRAGADDRVLEIVVSDTGCGIDPAHAVALFTPFTQGDASTSRRYGGTGLGLALSRSLARALGGDVVLDESSVGSGSRFRITLDISAVSTDAAANRPAVATMAMAPFGSAPVRALTGAKILVVDDTPDILVMLQESLSLNGATVHTAEDGPQGLDMALKIAYDVILMDIQLPKIDGYEVTRRLRAAGRAAAIIALTGRASKGEHEACLAAGCDDYLAKPVSLVTLIGTVAGWRTKDVR